MLQMERLDATKGLDVCQLFLQRFALRKYIHKGAYILPQLRDTTVTFKLSRL